MRASADLQQQPAHVQQVWRWRQRSVLCSSSGVMCSRYGDDVSTWCCVLREPRGAGRCVQCRGGALWAGALQRGPKGRPFALERVARLIAALSCKA